MNSNKNLQDFSNNSLISHLIELAKELEKSDIPLILGGGLSLYLRTELLNKEYSTRYPKRTLQRSTKDIDIFLTGEIIGDPEKVTLIRDALSSLGYKPVTKYFQFSKKEIGETSRDILIDILSSPPSDESQDKVITKGIRIKPAGIENFHAYLVKEARDINLGLIPINNFDNFSSTISVSNVFILSSYNYIILKLHAFRDRLNDETVDFGQHHAYDIFSTVADMDKADWENAIDHFLYHQNEKYIQTSQQIISKYFSDNNDLGVIRLRENKLYQRDRDEYDKYLQHFISDLKALFKL